MKPGHLRWLIIWEQTPLESFLAAAPQDSLLFKLEPGLAGAWTDLHDGREMIRFGYPENSESAWFQIHRPPRRGHNLLTLAVERLIFARGIKGLAIVDPPLAPVCEEAVRPHRKDIAFGIRHSGQSADNFVKRLQRQ